MEADHLQLVVEVLQVGAVVLEHRVEVQGLEVEQGELVRERRELAAEKQVHDSLTRMFSIS